MVDSAISVINKHMTVSFFPSFKHFVDKLLEDLLKAFFAFAGPALQPAIVAMYIY